MKRSATMLDAASITWALGKDSRPRAWRELPVGVLSGWHTGGDGQEPRRCPVLFLDWCSIVPRLFLYCCIMVYVDINYRHDENSLQLHSILNSGAGNGRL